LSKTKSGINDEIDSAIVTISKDGSDYKDLTLKTIKIIKWSE
jgi:hypothetical protein